MSILAFFDKLAAADEAPVDVEADAIIRALFKRYPDAAYRVTKLAMALEAAPADLAVHTAASEPRGWFSSFMGRRHSFAS